jgi:hypothetical protein
MYKRAARAIATRRAMRPSLELVERRRREQLEERGSNWWPSAPWARAAAASILVSIALSGAVGLGLSADAGILAVADPALAQPATRAERRTALEQRRHLIVRASVHAANDRGRKKIAARGPQHTGRISNATVHKGQPPPSISPLPPTATATPLPSSSPESASPLRALPWRLSADGTWTTIVSLALPEGVDAAKLNVDFSSNNADVLPLDAHAVGAPGAIITVVSVDGAVNVTASSDIAAVGRTALAIAPPPSGISSFGAVAQTVGPHLIDIGWTSLDPSAGVTEYKIYRKEAGARKGVLVGVVSPSGRSWHDHTVEPTTAYRYSVVAPIGEGSLAASTGFVATQPIMQPTAIGAVSGKGMFLYFTPVAGEPNGYDKYLPDAVIARALANGISHIELRLARGTFFEAPNPDVHAWLDAFVDKAAAAGIRLIAWQVPRRASTDDAAQAVAIARYRTQAGNGFSGLALDIEDGDNYMGFGAEAKQRMVDHIEMVRQAVGPDYLVVATVMSPKLTHWTNRRYPYDRIAPYASVMQPMEYWHHFYSTSGHEYTQDEVTSACADSVSMTRSLAGRDIPINVAGQSDDLGSTGTPSPDEITWCLTGSKAAGAVGDTFFDWRGTNDLNWSAISGFAW